jgi:chemotaxis protein methyltransferase CheR
MAAETISDVEFKLLRDYIELQCGIALSEDKTYLVETRLAGLLAENGCADFGSFYRLASGGTKPDLKDKIVDAMTTNETLWFRDGHPFRILREKLLPELADHLKQGRRFRIRIWSAASSTGQEPYSIAMEILEFCRRNPGLSPDQFEILATDISPSALFLARAARYDNAAIGRGMPEELKAKYFTQAGQVWSLNEEVKKMVTLRKFNLQDPLGPLGRFDIVFCRYVTIYFAEPFKKRIYEGIAQLLAPEGYLIISAVENLGGYSNAFQNLSHSGGTYYQCRTNGVAP